MKWYDSVLVTGTIRGGTKYIRAILQKSGIGQFGHEHTFMPCGINLTRGIKNEVSGYAAPMAKYIWTRTYVVQQTRHPIKVAESVNANLIEWLRVDGPNLKENWIPFRVWPELRNRPYPDRGLLYWVNSHQALLDSGRVRRTWRVEDFCEEDLAAMLHELDIQFNGSMLPGWVNSVKNDKDAKNLSIPEVHREDHQYDWDDFDQGLADKAKALAERFGYDV